MSDSEFYSEEEDQLNKTVVDPPKTPLKSFKFQTQQEALDYYKTSPTPSQNTRSSGLKLFQQKIAEPSIKMTDKNVLKLPIFIDPKPLEDPILENPLEDFFEADVTQEEMDFQVKEPFKLNQASTAEQRERVRNVHKINRLKKDRSNIYSSITKMTKTIMNVMNGKGQRDWEELQQRAITAGENLWDITDQLHKQNIEISPEEDAKFRKYEALLESHIAKIKSHVRSQRSGIANLMLATEKAFKPEPEHQRDGMNDYAEENGGDADGEEQNANQAMVMQQMFQSLLKLNKQIKPDKKPDSDYRSLKPIEIIPFSGDTMKYHYFKESFKTAHDWRNLPKTMLALQLQSHLKGPALKLCQDHLKNTIDETSYEKIWEALENRYGGSFNEDASITEQFEKLPVLRSLNFKELERTYDAFKLQSDYYHREDRNALNNTKSLLNKQAKAKLTVELGYKYIAWCAESGLPKNFASMLEWLNVNYKFAQESNREYNHSAEDKQTFRQKDRFHATRDPDSENSENEGQNASESKSSDDEKTITFNPRDNTYWVQPKYGGTPYQWNGKSSFPKKAVHFDHKTKRFGERQHREPLKLKPTDVCVLCKTSHEMSSCSKFKNLSIQEKKLIVRSSVLCFHCLSTKHFLRDCKERKGQLCGIQGCKLYHHPLIHADKLQINVEYDHDNFQPLTEEEMESISYLFTNQESINHIAHKGAVSLQTVVCNVESNGKSIKTVALLDTGSTMTAIDEDFAFENNLKILGKREGQEVYVIDRLVKMDGYQYLVEFTISSVDNDTSTRIEAWTIKNLVQDCGIVDWSERKVDFPHLKKINFPKLPKNAKITVLFGCNVTRLFASTKTIVDRESRSGPVAIRTFLGWTCVGNSANPKQLRKDPTPELVNILLKPREEN